MTHDGRHFELGEYLDGKDEAGNFINGEILGRIVCFPTQQLNVANIKGEKRRVSGRDIYAVALRNMAGSAVAPKRVVSRTLTAPTDFTTDGIYNVLLEGVDGYSGSAKEPFCAVVDPFLPSAGCPDDDIFWGIIKGPVDVTIGTALTTLAIGQALSSDGAGYLGAFVAGTDRHDALIGYALEASTSPASTDVLLDVCIAW
jgi:hypothetical protein